MTARLSRHAVLPGAGVLLVAVLAGCGSAPAPTTNAALGSGRSLQETCPRLGQALRQGFVSSSQLTTLATATNTLVAAGNTQVKRKLTPLSESARALAAAPSSEPALSAFQKDVLAAQDACTKQGNPMTY